MSPFAESRVWLFDANVAVDFLPVFGSSGWFASGCFLKGLDKMLQSCNHKIKYRKDLILNL